jgi:hypothetical protein
MNPKSWRKRRICCDLWRRHKTEKKRLRMNEYTIIKRK